MRLFLMLLLLGSSAWADLPFHNPVASPSLIPVFPPCDPTSEISTVLSSPSPSLEFCSVENPDFRYNGRQCCGGLRFTQKNKVLSQCSAPKGRVDRCSQITAEQKEYMDLANSGRLGDLLVSLTQEMGSKGQQAYCTVNNGFLVNGRPIVPSAKNRIRIRSPERCMYFGTDPMVAMLEWVGREVDQFYSDPVYSGVQLILGDVSAPKGGCVFNFHGKRGHASHTSGQDADVGFLVAKPGQESINKFHQEFDPATNWWLLKKVFKNPYACVKKVFLDKRHIQTLKKYALLQKDKDWKAYEKLIRHMKGHKNHFHIRVGDGPGIAGCSAESQSEIDFEEDDLDSAESTEAAESIILDQLKTRQSSSIHQ